MGATCGACLARPPSYDATLGAYLYAFPVDRLVQAFKYRRQLALAEWCADAIIAKRSPQEMALLAPNAIVALPLAAERQRERGFNQAAEIARVVAARTAIKLVRAGVRRIGSSAPQAALPWSERARNVRGVLTCALDLAGARIAVVDDVMTTGATLAEFARAEGRRRGACGKLGGCAHAATRKLKV